MSVLGSPNLRLPIGTVVRSVTVGRKAEFVGTITSYAAHGNYNVTDANGNGWHRSRFEIQAIETHEPSIPSQARGS